MLGSGWVPAADAIGTAVGRVRADRAARLRRPGGRRAIGRVRSVPVGDKRVLVFLGRTHLYEGAASRRVVHGVRTAAAAGCRTIVLTNGCGGLRATYLASGSRC